MTKTNGHTHHARRGSLQLVYPKRGALWLMRSYNFVDGKDPECDRFRTLYQKEHIKESELAVLAGCSLTTVKNLFGGQTRQPRHATFAKLASAMGYRYTLSRELSPNYEEAIPKAREEFKAYKAAQKKKRDKDHGKRERKERVARAG